MNHASITSRFIAMVIDTVILTTLYLIFMLLFGVLGGIITEINNPIVNSLSVTALLVLFVTVMSLQFVYYGYFWSTTGQTLGMKWLNVKVVDQKTQQPISLVKGALRGTLGYYISGSVGGLGYIWAIFDDNKQAWHDKIFNTQVVNTV